MIADFLAQARSHSPLEVTAVVLAVGYLVLAIRQNIWCWLCAGVSTSIYMYLFVEAKLYMESLLNGFYLAMAIYGWWVWMNGGRDRPDLPVTTWPLRLHGAAIGLIAVSTAITGFLLARHTDAAFPYADSLTTFGAVWATFLVARKVLENWWYWFVIDGISVVIYWLRDLPLTALLFVFYLVLIPIGLWKWTQSWRTQTAQ